MVGPDLACFFASRGANQNLSAFWIFPGKVRRSGAHNDWSWAANS